MKKLLLLVFPIVLIFGLSGCSTKERNLVDENFEILVGNTYLKKDAITDLNMYNESVDGIVPISLTNINKRHYYTIYFNEMKDKTFSMTNQEKRENHNFKKKSLSYKEIYDDTDPFLNEGNHRIAVLVTTSEKDIPKIISGKEKNLIEYEYSVKNIEPEIEQEDSVDYEEVNNEVDED